RLDDVAALVNGGDDGIAPRRLGRIDLRAVVFHQPQFDQLAVRLVNLRQDRPAGGGDDGVLRQRPAELFGDLKTVRLGAFGVIRAKVDVDDRPAVLVGNLGTQAVDIVIVAADADHGRPEDELPENFALLQIVRDHDKAADAGLGRVRGG